MIERARSFQRRFGLSFWEAFWATRAGNIFTTHTPVDAGFDRFPPALISTNAHYLEGFLGETGVSPAKLLALGRADPNDAAEPFNMAYLAMRSSARSIGVSQQHEAVSRRIFKCLFPRWPECEVPVGYVTNGCPRSDLGLARGRPPLDNGLRQGPVALCAERTRWPSCQPNR